MRYRALLRRVVAASFVAAVLPTGALAQMPKPGEVTSSTSLSGVHHFDTDRVGLTLSHRY